MTQLLIPHQLKLMEFEKYQSVTIIFTIKETKLYVPIVTLSGKDKQEVSELLSKRFERSVYWNQFKIKSKNKNMTKEYRCFL